MPARLRHLAGPLVLLAAGCSRSAPPAPPLPADPAAALGWLPADVTLVRLHPDAASLRMPVAFLFGSDAAAESAVLALGAAGKDERFPEPARLALAALRPEARGSEVHVDAARLMMDTPAMEAAVRVMKERVEGR